MEPSLLISVIALLFSVITYILHDRRIKKQEGLINKYQLEKIDAERIEQNKALIKANFIRGTSGKNKVMVYNAGKSAARNINLEILSEDKNFMVLNQDIFPFDLMNPQENTVLYLTTFEGSPDTLRIRLTWNDHHDLNNAHEQILTL